MRVSARARSTLRIIAASGLGAALLLAYGFWMQPYSAGQEGATVCLPIIGPAQRFNPDIPDSTLRGVLVHENVHAVQCRRNGFFGQLFRTQRTLGRLGIEAEAQCAEARWHRARGEDPRRLFLFAADALTYDTRGLDQLPFDVVRDSLAAHCPELAWAAAPP